jgi:hypothetical protein
MIWKNITLRNEILIFKKRKKEKQNSDQILIKKIKKSRFWF